MDREVIAVIPARFGSTRFPGKPLALICGEPLIKHVWNRARAASRISRVVVATDDQRILDVVAGFGGEGVMTSPDHASGSDRLGEVAHGFPGAILVNVQGDEPLLDPDVIDQVVARFDAEDPPDIVTAATPLRDRIDFLSPDVVKVVVGDAGEALYFSRSPVPWQAGDGLPQALRHIGIYAFERNALLKYVSLPPGKLESLERLEQLRAVENGMRIGVVTVPHDRSIGVDRPEDVARVERILSEARDASAAGFKEGS